MTNKIKVISFISNLHKSRRIRCYWSSIHFICQDIDRIKIIAHCEIYVLLICFCSVKDKWRRTITAIGIQINLRRNRIDHHFRLNISFQELKVHINFIVAISLNNFKCFALHSINLPINRNCFDFSYSFERNWIKGHVQIVVAEIFLNLTVRDIWRLDKSKIRFKLWTDGTIVVFNQITTIVSNESHVVVSFILSQALFSEDVFLSPFITL